MKIKLIIGTILLVCCFLFPQFSSGCQLGLKPVTNFDSAEYIFVGEVTGIVGPFKSKKMVGETWGLVVKPEVAIFLPEPPKDYFEVFTYQLLADCSTEGRSKEYLSETYPVGSKVRVIAKRATYLMSTSVGGRRRLEDAPEDRGGIYRINDESSIAFTNSIYDYKAGRYKGQSITAADVTPKFEMRKDLLRLRRAKSGKESAEILERLVYYPSIWDEFDLAGIAERHIKGRRKITSLVKKREAEEKRQMDEFAKSNK